MGWFTLAAIYSGIAVILLEDIRPPKLWARCLVTALIELSVFLALHQSLAWILDKATEASFVTMGKDAYESKILGLEVKWQRNVQQAPNYSPASASTSTRPSRLDKPQRTVSAQKPDISIQVEYATGFAVTLVDSGKVVLHEPKFSAVVWDLDIADRNDPLPVPVWAANDWIRPGEGMGPQPVLSLPNVFPLIKKGDRIFGFLWVSCPDCIRTKYYWVYEMVGRGGWYSELPTGQVPAISTLLKMLPQLRTNLDQLMATLPASDRKPILELQ